jgi:hypothetical protein
MSLLCVKVINMGWGHNSAECFLALKGKTNKTAGQSVNEVNSTPEAGVSRANV